MRPGWMRPSDTSFSRASRATSRRIGSKHETTTVSGVSSMMTSTPVASSNARMLRPSRPMIRPFISSLGSDTAETVDSAVCSAAMRWIASATIFLASRSASRLARSRISRSLLAASACASSSSRRISSALASCADMPASLFEPLALLGDELLQLLLAIADGLLACDRTRWRAGSGPCRAGRGRRTCGRVCPRARRGAFPPSPPRNGGRGPRSRRSRAA